MNSVKIISIPIVLLLIGMSIPTTATDNIAEDSYKIIETFNGNILYVGGSGPGNYTAIQDAIDNASDDDTVFVYDESSPYYENIVIKKSIDLIGESKNTTVIDGGGSGHVVCISSDFIEFSEFTIWNSGDNNRDAGIYINSSYNNISNNIISDNKLGIYVDINDNYGIYDNIITQNTILKNDKGIFLMMTYNAVISKNIIISNDYGIYTRGGVFFACNNTIIIRNSIINNTFGIELTFQSSASINFNNFINNKRSATFFLGTLDRINWNNNFWGRLRILPKPILGMHGFFILRFPWLDFDWHPAQEPYDI